MKSPLLNIMLMCVVWPVIATFLKCHDCTKHLGSGGSKNAEYIASIMIASIRWLPRPRCLDLIITDGAGDMTKFRRLVTAVFGSSMNWVTSLLGTRARSLASDACRLVSKSNECGHTAQPCAQARAGA